MDRNAIHVIISLTFPRTGFPGDNPLSPVNIITPNTTKRMRLKV